MLEEYKVGEIFGEIKSKFRAAIRYATPWN